MIVTGGGLSLDGTRWIATNPKFLMVHGGLKKRWKYQVVTRMRKAAKKGVWRFPKSVSFLKDYPRFSSLLNKLWAMTWYAFIGASLADPSFSVAYIGRYTKRAVLAEYRITFYDGRMIRFSFKDYAQGGKISYKTLPVNAFIGRLIRHIPDKNFPISSSECDAAAPIAGETGSSRCGESMPSNGSSRSLQVGPPSGNAISPPAYGAGRCHEGVVIPSHYVNIPACLRRGQAQRISRPRSLQHPSRYPRSSFLTAPNKRPCPRRRAAGGSGIRNPFL